jgi:hypothetical protein
MGYAYEPSAVRAATPSRPTQPGCLPLVATSTSAELASMEAETERVIPDRTAGTEDGRASQKRIAPIPQPITVAMCQVAQRMRT